MKKSVYRRVMIGAVVFAMVSISGCRLGTTATKDKADSVSGLPQGTLSGTLTLQISAKRYHALMWQKVLQGFKRDYPHVQVEVCMGETADDEMEPRWEAGQPPDVVFLADAFLPSWIAAGRLMALTDWYQQPVAGQKESMMRDKFLPGILEDAGTVYQAPLLLEVDGFWYDGALFKKQKLKVPDEYTGLQNACDELGKQGIPLLYAEKNADALLWGVVMPLVAAQGNESAVETICHGDSAAIFREPAFQKAMKRLEEFAQAGGFPKTAPAERDIAVQEWLQGKAAFLAADLTLPLHIRDDTPVKFDLRFATGLFSKIEEASYVFMGNTGLGIAEKAGNKANALAFLSYVYQDKSLLSLVSDGKIPVACHVDIAEGNISAQTRGVLQLLSSPENTLVYKPRWSDGRKESVCQAIQAVVSGEMTAENACKRLADTAP